MLNKYWTYKDKIPYVDGVGDSFRVGKNYTLKPYFLKDQIIFYLAERIYGGKTFLDWIISPNSLDEFKKRESTDIPIITDSYSDKAFNLYRYLLYYEHYDWYESVLKLWSGDSRALATLSLRNLKEQWKNPENWIVSADIYLRWVSALKGAERLKIKNINEVANKKNLYCVDESFKIRDQSLKILEGDVYKLNPTATNVDALTINPSGTIKGKLRLDPNAKTMDLLNGKEYMYVVDINDNIIIVTRTKGMNFSTPDGFAPHPTLIGGSNIQVKAAGTIEFRGGKIYKVDNASGHFKPSLKSLDNAKEIFKKKFSEKSFSNDFQGFVEFTN